MLLIRGITRDPRAQVKESIHIFYVMFLTVGQYAACWLCNFVCYGLYALVHQSIWLLSPSCADAIFDRQGKKQRNKLQLVPRGSPDQCVFEQSAFLRAGAEAKLVLKSHPGFGIGLEHNDEKRYYRWRYIEPCPCPAVEAIHVEFVREKFIKLTSRDLVFCASFRKSESTPARLENYTPVSFVGAENEEQTYLEETLFLHWTLNTYGTISLMHREDLVLGVVIDGHEIEYGQVYGEGLEAA